MHAFYAAERGWECDCPKDRFHMKGEKIISSPSHRFVIVRMHAGPELSLGQGFGQHNLQIRLILPGTEALHQFS